MTIKQEDRLIDELRTIEGRRRDLIRKIVAQRRAGKDDATAMDEMRVLAQRKIELTRPVLVAA